MSRGQRLEHHDFANESSKEDYPKCFPVISKRLIDQIAEERSALLAPALRAFV